MMAYSGLETMYQNTGPMVGGYFAGRREATAEEQSSLEAQMKQEEIDKAQQDYLQKQQTNPLDVQQKQGAITAQQAELPGLQGLAQQNQVKGREAAALEPSTTSAGIAANAAKLTHEQVVGLSDVSRMGGQLAAQLSAIPPAAHEAVKRQFMKENNIDPNSGSGQHILNSTPAQLTETARRAGELTDAYIQHLATIKEASASKERIEAAAREAGKYKKGTTVSYTMKFMSMPIDRQNAEIASAMATGKSPITGEPMTEDEKSSLIARFQQNKATLDAQIAARAQPGVVPQTSGTGGITLQNKPIPQTGSLGGATPALPAGWTMK